MQHDWLNIRWRLLLLLGSALGGGFAAEARAVGRTETLQAIQAVENPHHSARPGKHGELGPYQFRRNTWRMHTKAPFEDALDRQVAEQVAVRHYEWLKRGLVRNGYAPTSYNIALAWNSGLAAVVRGRASATSRDYAARVNNLAQEIRATQLASVP